MCMLLHWYRAIFLFLKNEKRKYDEFTPFLYGKIKRLIVPYIFVCIAWVIPIGICISNYTLSDIMKKYLLATAPSQLWFLWMLFGCLYLHIFWIILSIKELLYQSLCFISYGLALIGFNVKYTKCFLHITFVKFFYFFLLLEWS